MAIAEPPTSDGLDVDVDALAAEIKAESEAPEAGYQISVVRLTDYQPIVESTVRLDRQYEDVVRSAGAVAVSIFLEKVTTKVLVAKQADRIIRGALTDLVSGRDPDAVERDALHALHVAAVESGKSEADDGDRD